MFEEQQQCEAKEGLHILGEGGQGTSCTTREAVHDGDWETQLGHRPSYCSVQEAGSAWLCTKTSHRRPYRQTLELHKGVIVLRTTWKWSIE
jgi:hypothetical protein